MLSRRTAKTRQEDVYQKVRADILAGKLRPGQRLRLAELRAAHGVSTSVVREALTRLAEQKLVRLEPQQGFAVASLSVPDLLDLTAVRVAIEDLALRRSIERGDVAWEARIVAANHVLANTPRDDYSDGKRRMNEAWAAAHAVFHATLVDACGSPILRDLCRSLYDASEFYRRCTYSETGFSRDVVVEHRALMEAVLARDVERAVALLTAHFENTTRTVLARLPSIAPRPTRRAGRKRPPAVDRSRT